MGFAVPEENIVFERVAFFFGTHYAFWLVMLVFHHRHDRDIERTFRKHRFGNVTLEVATVDDDEIRKCPLGMDEALSLIHI